jgi:hypothetical protein
MSLVGATQDRVRGKAAPSQYRWQGTFTSRPEDAHQLRGVGAIGGIFRK